MAKSKEKKNQIVEELNNNLKSHRVALLVDYKGLKVKEIQSLRRKLAEKGISLEVMKNSLFRIALKNQNLEIDNSLLNRPLAISFADDEVEVSKELVAARKETEALEILGGLLDQKFVDESVIIQLSKLPGREELYAKLVGSINFPISGLVNVLAGSIRNLVNVLNNYKEKIA